ncbi:hypothetical protein WN51_08756 [Melipona quadrifasciata]|uniref:Uncharacterized protein n=1 Tax=Melipona quadrifasciata TaxID=166423 RepID=A0A0M8ZQT8_9HYME|nr:hypothetical protein WN51_08756 [Melipona quadrifasciata]
MSLYREADLAFSNPSVSRDARDSLWKKKREIGIIHGRTKPKAEGVFDWTERGGPFHVSASGWSLPARAETRGLCLPLALLAPSHRAERVWSGVRGLQSCALENYKLVVPTTLLALVQSCHRDTVETHGETQFCRSSDRRDPGFTDPQPTARDRCGGKAEESARVIRSSGSNDLPKSAPPSPDLDTRAENYTGNTGKTVYLGRFDSRGKRPKNMEIRGWTIAGKVDACEEVVVPGVQGGRGGSGVIENWEPSRVARGRYQQLPPKEDDGSLALDRMLGFRRETPLHTDRDLITAIETSVRQQNLPVQRLWIIQAIGRFRRASIQGTFTTANCNSIIESVIAGRKRNAEHCCQLGHACRFRASPRMFPSKRERREKSRGVGAECIFCQLAAR